MTDIEQPLSGAELARWCYENPNLAARTIEGLRDLAQARLDPLAEQALRNFVENFSVRVPDDGLCKDRLCGIFGSPGAEYFFLVAGNSYDEMVLGHLRHSLAFARVALSPVPSTQCAGGVDPGWDECPKCGATSDDACAVTSTKSGGAT